ncbi:MAG: serine/threonine protein kinase [Planctomycetota bacterium]|nr:serine/threonine protein kinase [Planctomycetota bacterium]
MTTCEQAASRIGDYELLYVLGQGGMGTVYRARQVSLDRVVALKVLPQSHVHDREFVQRFMQEARAVAKLNHLNIVAGYDVGFVDGHFFFAMELVEGTSLGRHIHQQGRITEHEATVVGAAIARALAHAHAHDIIHRDVKPDNIVVAADGTPKLTDFGLARANPKIDLEITQTGHTVGTAHYMAPEQITGKDIDGRADQYALGCTLFKAVTGKPPFDGETSHEVLYKHLRDRMPNLHAIRTDLSDGFCVILHRMMARTREERYPDMAKVADDFEALLAGRFVRHRSRAATKACKPRHSGEHERVATRKHASVKEVSPWVRVAAYTGMVSAVVALTAVFSMGSSRNAAPADAPAAPLPTDRAPRVERQVADRPSELDAPVYAPRNESYARSEPAPASRGVPRTVFNGEEKHPGKGWASPDRAGAVSLQKFKGRNGRAAVEFKGSGKGWIGGGWNWTGWAPGAPCVDTRAYSKMIVSVRVVTQSGATPDVKVGLASPGTRSAAGLLPLKSLDADAADGRWHDVEIPIEALYRHNRGNEYDPAKAFELVLHAWAEKEYAFSVYVEQIAFE